MQDCFLHSLYLYEASPLWSDTQVRKQSCNHCLISHFPSLPRLRVAAACQLLKREVGNQKHHYQIEKEKLLTGFEACLCCGLTFHILHFHFFFFFFFFPLSRCWEDEGAIAPPASQGKSWFITKAGFIFVHLLVWTGLCLALFVCLFVFLRNTSIGTE